jgi:DNA-binding PadR family transcriptional regulator|tara:strand:- start:76 stop:303 length:228 start_codon:yes stop_codon:yes gene_type:complete
MEYYELQESGLIKALQEKTENLELDFGIKIERLIWDALESQIEELPEDKMLMITDEIFDLSSRLGSEIENSICQL